MIDTIVMMPPDVVLIRASSTVFVKASSLVNLDFGGIVSVALPKRYRSLETTLKGSTLRGSSPGKSRKRQAVSQPRAKRPEESKDQ
jgi:hypothetical protein